jgi:hypothetical protein
MELSLPEFVYLILLVTSSGVIIFTLISRWAHFRYEKHALKRRIICRLCLHAFEDESPPGTLVNCPKCNAANQKAST